MSETLDEDSRSVTTPRVPAKRRKPRKGTRSCWECKRRKIRCMLASPGDAICIGCQHRRVPCVPQDVPDGSFHVPTRRDNRTLSDRVAQVEKLVNDALASSRGQQSKRIDQAEPFLQPLTLVEAEMSGQRSCRPLSPGTTPEGGSPPSPLCSTPCSGRYGNFDRRNNIQPSNKMTLDALAAPYPAVELPRPGDHPVILAKLMLIFAIALQSPSGEKTQGLSRLSEQPSVLVRRLVTAAKSWVTTNEEMHGSIDCLVCIILEGVYEVNCGNLRRAWAVFRRAITVAQLMGLHRSPLPPLQRIDPKLDADPEFMWFRIVYMDRHLSLLLGLPQGTSDKAIGITTTLQNEPPLGKFERLLTAVASRILQRNGDRVSAEQPPITQSIDTELLEVARSVPPSFWCPPEFHLLKPGSPEALLETKRLAAHVYYHGLLIQLHLPFALRIGDNRVDDYSKITCVSSSREIIVRFIAHRAFNPSSSCSRPVDFFALQAAMTLLLAHLGANHHQKGEPNTLAHQRLSDRAMLEQALERMIAIKTVNKDVTTEKSAELIRRLLEIEADAAGGSRYTARTAQDGDGGTDQPPREGEGQVLLAIPYFGVVRIARQGPISRRPLTANVACCSQEIEPPRQAFGQSPDAGLVPSWYDPPGVQCPIDGFQLSVQEDFPPITASVNDWAFQGVDMAFFDSLTRGTTGFDATMDL
ncbi:hypothetical protein C7999DRAFT_40543 [Corynascus novoguineensis]|uniref:Zn(2)-C6 fungal-type domain-containing protein n=1 Tax=Corynascus novoguineensis TaxID=1126955 RepID=A0AAN7CUR4_9PEZI|nr:hypothetical protein C7999DRAFT_40543 [Corynascus novoguineensis]